MDSCENAFDTPLMYEKGWGKKYAYVFANSKDETVDVTRRYIVNSALNRMRRTEINEEWLRNHLAQRREHLWSKSGRLLELRARYDQEVKTIDEKFHS
jgi:peptide-N4-(N-acetyl-beta-glucosaminyl)asparagine amidase